jgi:hypothetical protein
MKFRLLFAPVLAALIAGVIYLLGSAVLMPWRPASISQPAWEQSFGFGGLIVGCIVANRWVRREKNRLKAKGEWPTR